MSTKVYILAWFIIGSCLALVGLDGAGVLDLSKFGYGAIGGIIALVVQYYYRKKPPSSEPGQNGTPQG